MIPLRDNIPSRRTPGVVFVLMGACVLVFLFQFGLPSEYGEQTAYRFGFVPLRVRAAVERETFYVVFSDTLQPTPVGWQQVRRPRILNEEEWQQLQSRLGYGMLWTDTPPAYSIEPNIAMLLVSLVTMMFLHGGWLHLIGNMWYLWIFGDNVEDRLGHGRFLLMYVLSGLAGSGLHLVFNWEGTGSAVPAIGASGAISGVLGAYLVSYPFARILTFFPLFGLLGFWEVPAVVWLGFWFFMQFFTGTQSLVAGDGSVAWWAHVGGFAAGVILVKVLGPKSLRRSGQ